MVYCEDCGSSNEEGAIFCSVCGSNLSDTPVSFSEIDLIKKEQKTANSSTNLNKPGFSIKKQSQVDPIILRYLILILGGFSVVLGLATLVEDYPSMPSIASFPSFPSFPSFSGTMIIPMGFTVLALIIIFLIYRDSKKDPLIFLSIGVAIITIGFAIMIPESSYIIFPMGFTIVGLLLILLLSRHWHRDPLFFIGLVVIDLTFGLGIMIPNSFDIVFPMCLIIIGILAGSWAIWRYPLSYNKMKAKAKYN